MDADVPGGGIEGTTAIFMKYRQILIGGSEHRDLARNLLRTHGLLAAIEEAAKALEHVGKSDDARLLRGPVPAMSHWDADDLEFLRISALALLDAGLDLAFAEVEDAHATWSITIEPEGERGARITVVAPPALLCQVTSEP